MVFRELVHQTPVARRNIQAESGKFLKTMAVMQRGVTAPLTATLPQRITRLGRIELEFLNGQLDQFRSTEEDVIHIAVPRKVSHDEKPLFKILPFRNRIQNVEQDGAKDTPTKIARVLRLEADNAYVEANGILNSLCLAGSWIRSAVKPQEVISASFRDALF